MQIENHIQILDQNVDEAFESQSASLAAKSHESYGPLEAAVTDAATKRNAW